MQRRGPTQAELKSLFSYQPETGLFFRIARADGRSLKRTNSPAGTPNSKGYLQVKIGGRMYLLSRLAFLYMTGKFPACHVDHIDRNPLNNSWSNLRDVDQSTNNRNRRTVAGKSSRFRGVSRRGDKWQVVVRDGGKLRFLGHFNNEEEAGSVAAPYFEGIPLRAPRELMRQMALIVPQYSGRRG